jgi:hypothetical protein
MAMQRTCNCRGEYVETQDVLVINNTIIEPDNEVGLTMKTMDELFDTIWADCLATCPEKGPADCTVVFSNQTVGSYISELFIDHDEQVADEETWYTVYNLTFCEDGQAESLDDDNEYVQVSNDMPEWTG